MTFGHICEDWSNFCIGIILVKCQLWVKGFLDYISQAVFFFIGEISPNNDGTKGPAKLFKGFLNEKF
jgi:hypothetical protein